MDAIVATVVDGGPIVDIDTLAGDDDCQPDCSQQRQESHGDGDELDMQE